MELLEFWWRDLKFQSPCKVQRFLVSILLLPRAYLGYLHCSSNCIIFTLFSVTSAANIINNFVCNQLQQDLVSWPMPRPDYVTNNYTIRHLKGVHTNVVKTHRNVLQSQVTFCAGFISNTHIYLNWNLQTAYLICLIVVKLFYCCTF
jgi:hypothetical protein